MFELPEMFNDYHATYSIQLCELVDSGFDPFGDARWASADWYDAEQRARFESKFKLRYWRREIGLIPAGYWREKLTSLVVEQLPKYKILYAAIAEGIDLLSEGSEYGKKRDVYSSFPATQLNAEREDYAKSAQDNQYETIRDGSYIDKALDIQNRYNDVDVMLLNDCEEVFSCLMSATLPAM